MLSISLRIDRIIKQTKKCEEQVGESSMPIHVRTRGFLAQAKGLLYQSLADYCKKEG